MAIYSGTIDNVGTTISQKALLAIKNACEAEGWVTVEYNTDSANNHVWVARSSGLSGTEEIYIAIRTNDNPGSSIYTMTFHVLPLYVPGITFASQNKLTSPWFAYSSSFRDSQSWISFGPFENQYFIFVNAQRVIWMSVKSGDVVNSGYMGKFFPFARPDQYPLPVLAMYGTADTGTVFNAEMLEPGLIQYGCGFHPNATQNVTFSSRTIREVDGVYGVHPVYPIKYSTGYLFGEVYGQLDGFFQCSGDNLQNLSVIQVGGSSIVDQTGLSILAAVSAIDAVGGEAYIAAFHGTLRGQGDAYCVRAE